MREYKFRIWTGNHMAWDYPAYTEMGTLQFPPNTVPMQYTGLKDKQGKEICEGDIVSYYDSTTMWLKAEVKWIDAMFVIQHESMHGDFIELMSFAAEEPSLRGIEVIGNIYENPELLGEKND